MSLSWLRPELLLFPFCFSLQQFCFGSPCERSHTCVHAKVLTQGNYHFWRYQSREKQRKVMILYNSYIKVTKGTTLQGLSENNTKFERFMLGVYQWERWVEGNHHIIVQDHQHYSWWWVLLAAPLPYNHPQSFEKFQLLHLLYSLVLWRDQMASISPVYTYLLDNNSKN